MRRLIVNRIKKVAERIDTMMWSDVSTRDYAFITLVVVGTVWMLANITEVIFHGGLYHDYSPSHALWEKIYMTFSPLVLFVAGFALRKIHGAMTILAVPIGSPIILTMIGYVTGSFNAGMAVSFVLVMVFIAQNVRPRYIGVFTPYVFLHFVAALVFFENEDPYHTFLMTLGVSAALVTMTTMNRLSVFHSEEELKKLSFTDGLTGMYSRRAVEDFYSDSKTESLGMLLMDLDRFKSINDTYGHPAGDAALKHVATIIKNTIRGNDFAGRLGGDEMIVICDDITSENLQRLGQRIVESVHNTPLVFEGNTIILSVSVGAAMMESEMRDFERHYEFADKSLYTAKEPEEGEGRNQVGEIYAA